MQNRKAGEAEERLVMVVLRQSPTRQHSCKLLASPPPLFPHQLHHSALTKQLKLNSY
jgi:hypothetical protein